MVVVRGAEFRSGAGLARRVVRLGGVALAIALVGCSPFETYRSLAGVDKNDPDPQTAPFTGNMAEAEAADYPNLATIPPPPSRATTAAERKKLAENLISERDTARSNPAPAASGPIVAPAMSPPPALPDIPKPPFGSRAAAAPPESAPAADAAAQPRGRNRPESGRRKQGEPPEPGPQDTSLETPELASLPDPEATRPPPPPPRLAAAPSSSAIAPLQPPPALAATATPQPAPPPPPIAMAAPPSSSAIAPLQRPPPPAIDQGQPRHPPAGATLASIAVSGDAAADAQTRELIARIAGLYKDKTDTLRVIAYAGTPARGVDPLDSYRAALDRAQAVAKMLGDAGMPATRVQAQATPAAGAAGAGDRIEIQLLPMTTAGPAR